MGHEVTRLVAAEDGDREVRIVLDAPDEPPELVERVWVQQIDGAVVEGHPPVGRGDFADMELLRSTHDTTACLSHGRAGVLPGLDEAAQR